MTVATAERQLETWKNLTAARVVINRIDGRGNEVAELIAGRKVFTLTPEERRLNSDRCADDSLDPFKNGTLSPVRLIDDDEDTESIKTNPNLLGDSDLKSLFRSKGDSFAEKVGGISNPITLNRLLEMAYELDATVGQVEAIKARLDQVNPQTVDVTAGSAGEVRTSAPQGRQRQNRGSGLTPDGTIRPVTPK